MVCRLSMELSNIMEFCPLNTMNNMVGDGCSWKIGVWISHSTSLKIWHNSFIFATIILLMIMDLHAKCATNVPRLYTYFTAMNITDFYIGFTWQLICYYGAVLSNWAYNFQVHISQNVVHLNQICYSDTSDISGPTSEMCHQCTKAYYIFYWLARHVDKGSTRPVMKGSTYPGLSSGMLMTLTHTQDHFSR